MKKACVLFLLCFAYFAKAPGYFAKAPGYFGNAHWTHHIVSNTMLFYLYDDILLPELEYLQLQYTQHLENFNRQETQTIQQRLNRELDRLNALPPAMVEQQAQLNKGVANLNQIIQKWNQQTQAIEQFKSQAKKEREQIKSILSKNTLQAEEITHQVNQLGQILNQQGQQLLDLEKQEDTARLFYLNQEYLNNPSLLQQQAELNQWGETANQEISDKGEKYNQSLSDFQTEQADKQAINSAKRDNIAQEQAHLAQYSQKINLMVDGYNQAREQVCSTQACVDQLKSTKEDIRVQKQEYQKQEQAFNQLTFNFQKELEQERIKRDLRLASLEHEKQELSRLKQDLDKQWNQKKQDLEQAQEQLKVEAKAHWDRAGADLNQFQALLAESYGGNFRFFVEQFAKWSHNNSNLSATSVADTTDICAYSETYPLATKAVNLCEHISNLDSLGQEFLVQNKKVEQANRTLSAKRAQKITLGKKIKWQKEQNHKMEQQLEQMTQQYDKDLPLRKREYDIFKLGLMEQLEIEKDQIFRAYTIKAKLLNKEYDMIKFWLSPYSFSFSAENVAEATSHFQKELKLMGEFVSSLDPRLVNFPEGFNMPYGLLWRVEQRAKVSSWYPLLQTIAPQEGFLSPVQEEDGVATIAMHQEVPVWTDIKESLQAVEGEHKKQLVLSWMQSDFISLFLEELLGQVARFSALEQAAPPVNIGGFVIPFLFLESVYQQLDFQQAVAVREAASLRDQIYLAFQDRVLWFLPSGKLETVQGVYQ